MKKLLIILMLLISNFVFSQEKINTTVIIGIGQSENTVILEDIQYYISKSKDMKIEFICEKHRILVINVYVDSKYKDPMCLIQEFEKVFDDTKFEIKNMNILKTDCYDEYIKYLND